MLLTDGELKATLPVLRSLAKKGVETGVAATDRRAMSFFSKYCKKKFLYHSPRENLSLFLKTIKRIVETSNFDILFPIGEWTIIPISEHQKEITSHVKLPFGSYEVVKKTFDKLLTLKLALDEGIPCPKTFFVDSLESLIDISKRVSYPQVIKSRWSWVWNQERALFSRPRYVSSPQELVSVYKDMHKKFPFPVIQEYIPGTAYHIGAICSHSQLRVACCIKEHRTIPVAGGYATFRETVKLDYKMKEFAERLLRALNWNGVAEVEFKLDSRDSIPKFMEINGRFWGSLELAIEAGIDFPYLLYRLVVDGDVKQTSEYKVGLKRRWLEGDIVHLSNVLHSTGAHPQIDFPEKWRTLTQFLKIHDGGYDCLYWDDPLPFLSRSLWGDIPNIFVNKFKRKIKGE